MHDAVVAARSFAEGLSADPALSSKLAIVVEELAMNLYDHGGLGAEDAFELGLTANDEELTLQLVAPGQKFDPLLVRPRRAPSAGAGAGLNLVKAWSDRLAHDYADGRNRVILTLPLRNS